MVSFSCEGCGDVLTKKKLDSHRNQCRSAFSCLDCSVTFYGTDYRAHTSCISEAQKYEKTVWKGDKKGKNKQVQQGMKQPEPEIAPAPVDVFAFQMAEEPDNRVAIVDAPPAAPSPPPMINVFDFMLESGAPSRRSASPSATWERNGHAAQEYQNFSTPAGHSRNVSTDSTTKKSSKRKRTQVEDIDASNARRFAPNGDVIMTDVPPVHSGLTGGVHRMMARPEFPPSPDYSGGEVPATSPASPLKRSKQEKAASKDKKASKSKDKDDGEKKDNKKDKDRSSKKSKREAAEVKAGHWVQVRKRPGAPLATTTTTTTRKRSKSPDATTLRTNSHAMKAIEYTPATSPPDPSSALVIHADRTGHSVSARAALFISFITTGSDTEKGCSVNKALKRYHRERGDRMAKLTEEKELWKSLRLRINERGEIVLFPAAAGEGV